MTHHTASVVHLGIWSFHRFSPDNEKVPLSEYFTKSICTGAFLALVLTYFTS